MIQIFVWSIIWMFTLLVIRKITPIPIVMKAWKVKNTWKCFLSVPVIDDPSNLPHVSSSYPIHTSLLSSDHPRILRPRTTGKLKNITWTIYSHTGQYDHTLSKETVISSYSFTIPWRRYSEDFFFFFSLCIFSQVRNIPERIILISTTGLRWRDYTHKHLTYNRYQSH